MPKKRKTKSAANEKQMWNSSKKKKKSGGGTFDFTLFQKLMDEPNEEDAEDEGVISMEGIATLGDKLGMDVTEDIRILMLLWKMEIPRPVISRQQWEEGCEKISIDGSLDGFVTYLPALDVGFLETTEFKEFFKFCFQFNRQGTHKSLDKELVVALLPMLLKGSPLVPTDRLESFTTFLEQNKDVAKVTADQWISFLDFCLEVKDISNYDESQSAWPVLIDEFVEYMEAQQQN